MTPYVKFSMSGLPLVDIRNEGPGLLLAGITASVEKTTQDRHQKNSEAIFRFSTLTFVFSSPVIFLCKLLLTSVVQYNAPVTNDVTSRWLIY